MLRRHAHRFGQLGRVDGRGDEGFVHHLFGIKRLRTLGIGVHQLSQQFLVQAAPVHSNAHRFVVAHGRFDHLAKLLVVLVTLAHVAGVDAVFGEGLGAVGVIGQQAVTVVMEVANQRDVNAHAVELFAHMRHGLRCLRRVDRQAHHF